MHLADVIPAEWEYEIPLVLCCVAGQRDRQVESQSEVITTTLKSINLLFGFSATFCQKNLSKLHVRSIDRREAIELVDFSHNGKQSVELDLLLGQILREAASGSGCDSVHVLSLNLL